MSCDDALRRVEGVRLGQVSCGKFRNLHERDDTSQAIQFTQSKTAPAAKRTNEKREAIIADGHCGECCERGAREEETPLYTGGRDRVVLQGILL